MEGRGAGTGGLSTRRTVTEGPEYLPGSWYNSALQLGRFWGLQVTLAIVSCREPSRAGRWSPTASKVQQAPHRRSAGCGWETCSKSLLQRGSEISRQLDTQSSEENFKELLKWASEYWQRESSSSYRGHRNLFEQFTGQKICLDSRKSANEFVASIVNER